MFQRRELVPEFEHAASRFQLAAIVAEYAEILRESYWAWQGSLGTVAAEAERVQRMIPDDVDVAEFVALTSWTSSLWESAGR